MAMVNNSDSNIDSIFIATISLLAKVFRKLPPYLSKKRMYFLKRLLNFCNNPLGVFQYLFIYKELIVIFKKLILMDRKISADVDKTYCLTLVAVSCLAWPGLMQILSQTR